MARGKKTGGRHKGTPNKLTTNARNAFHSAFDALGGVDALTKWADENKTDFYKIYARLIPVDARSNDQIIDITTLYTVDDMAILDRYAARLAAQHGMPSPKQ